MQNSNPNSQVSAKGAAENLSVGSALKIPPRHFPTERSSPKTPNIDAVLSTVVDQQESATNSATEHSSVRKISPIRIATLIAHEILDSRGNPTLSVQVTLSDGRTCTSSVPSGASTGANEAYELRDGDPRRYQGKGVLKAMANVNVIAPLLVGQDPTQMAKIDHLMIDLDGTHNKSQLGANAILGVSQACARAGALVRNQPLYQYLGGPEARILPRPMANIINGGKHADSGLDFQEFMLVPEASSFAEALRCVSETFHALHDMLKRRGLTVAVGDEGGFAPLLKSNEQAFELILEATTRAGYTPGKDVFVALDAAASSFYHDGAYHLTCQSSKKLSSDELIALYQKWVAQYPLISIEDGLAEDDWSGFAKLTQVLGDKVQIVGDDILVTNPIYIRRGIEQNTCNAALIKLNQIGTVTEAIEAIQLCRDAKWDYIISHRSGETEDCFMADFAVAMGGGQIKAGSVCRGERVAKYNRLMQIERELGARAQFS